MGSPAVRYFNAVVSYHGAAYSGWQYQPNARSVEEEIRDAARQVSSGPIETAGASRTDTGVHAVGQCCRIRMTTGLDAETVARALNAITPDDIAIRSMVEVDAEFSPVFDAIQKRYLYRVDNGRVPSPFEQDLQWWYPKPLDDVAMQAAADLLLGTHDFDVFRNASNDPPVSFTRTIQAATWIRRGDRLVFQVIGNGFLYKMVRNIVGTMIQIGIGRRRVESISELIAAGDRQLAGQTAPPQGLFLMDIRYPGDPPLEIGDGSVLAR